MVRDLRWLGLTGVLVFVLCMSPAALGASTLRGTFKATVTSTALHGELKGTWKLDFKRNGNLVATRNGKSAGKTKFTVKGSKLTLKPTTDCRSTATYDFTLAGTALKFKRLKDSCAPRRIVFSYKFKKA